MAPVLKAKTRDDAIRELVGVLARERIVQDTDKVVAAAVAREKVLVSSDAKTLWKELNKATRVAVKNM